MVLQSLAMVSRQNTNIFYDGERVTDAKAGVSERRGIITGGPPREYYEGDPMLV